MEALCNWTLGTTITTKMTVGHFCRPYVSRIRHYIMLSTTRVWDNAIFNAPKCPYWSKDRRLRKLSSILHLTFFVGLSSTLQKIKHYTIGASWQNDPTTQRRVDRPIETHDCRSSHQDMSFAPSKHSRERIGDIDNICRVEQCLTDPPCH